MFIGEIKKLVRNKKFIVVVSIMLLVEIMTIIYCLGEKNAEYVDYRNSLSIDEIVPEKYRELNHKALKLGRG